MSDTSTFYGLPVEVVCTKKTKTTPKTVKPVKQHAPFVEPTGAVTTGKMRAMLVAQLNRWYRRIIATDMNQDIFQTLELVLLKHDYREDMASIKAASNDLAREMRQLMKANGFRDSAQGGMRLKEIPGLKVRTA